MNEIAKTSQSSLELIFDSIDIAVIETNMKGEFIFWNELSTNIAGLNLVQDKTGDFTSVFKCFKGKGGQLLKKENLPSFLVLREKRAIDLRIFIPSSANGLDITLNVNCRPIYSSEGGITGSIMFVKNITKEVQGEERLLDQAKLVDIGKLSNSIAHEILNSLTVGLVGLRVLRKYLNPPSEDGDSYVNKKMNLVYDALSRIGDIVEGITVYSRKESSSIEAFSTHQVIEEAVDFFGDIINGERIELLVNFEAENDRIIGSSSKIHQILLNLIINAKDALKLNTGISEIKIDTESTDSMLILKVEDNGHGIPKDKIKNIFDDYYTTKPKGEGTGLGLSIIKKIVIEMGGTIEVSSVENEKTLFIMSFPLDVQINSHNSL